MNEPEPAITVTHVSKSFRLPHDKQNSIKGGLVSLFRNGRRTFETQEVLRDVSFEIKKGEFFGIVGRNGSGKSTLLKMLAGIYTPTGGNVIVHGTLTPFIELGVGFNPELTGRENVFLNGALLGFSQKEVAAMYNDIVAFAELERFMDQKLKNYSSGMQVRLAFSIAIRANGDILLLDEVLAVGDEAFQRKCYDYFENLKRNKKTVIIVTHDMAAVERFCTRAMFVENGEIVKIGDPHTIASAYSVSNDASFAISDIDGEQRKTSEIKIELLDTDHSPVTAFSCGDEMIVRLSWQHQGANYAGVSILSQAGEYIFGQNTYNEKVPVTDKTSIEYRVTLNIAEGKYYIVAGLFGRDDTQRVDFEEHGPEFIVNRDKNDSRWGGLTRLPHTWKVID